MQAEFKSVRETYGDLSFYASRDYTGHPLRKDQLHLVLKGTKSRLWCQVEIFLDYPSPKIYELTFKPVMPTEDLLGTEPFELSNALDALDNTLEQLDSMDMFAGVVLIANKDKILFHKVVGKADRHFDMDNSLDTKMNIGYMVDIFNAVALMQLIQAEKLSLKDNLSQFLDDTWLAKNMRQKIQIQHLLTHSSGLDHHWTGGHGIAPETLTDLKSYKPILKKVNLIFEPGNKNLPSNTAMHLSGAVLEAVTGENYFRYIEENIYQKSGMKQTGVMDLQQSDAAVAVHYYKRPESDWQKINDIVNGSPSGGVFSTAADLHRFALALLKHKLLNEDMTTKMFVPQMRWPMLDYGYGLVMQKQEDICIVGGFAGYPGFSSNLDIYPDSGYISVILSNQYFATLDDNGLQNILQLTREIIKHINDQGDKL